MVLEVVEMKGGIPALPDKLHWTSNSLVAIRIAEIFQTKKGEFVLFLRLSSRILRRRSVNFLANFCKN